MSAGQKRESNSPLLHCGAVRCVEILTQAGRKPNGAWNGITGGLRAATCGGCTCPTGVMHVRMAEPLNCSTHKSAHTYIDVVVVDCVVIGSHQLSSARRNHGSDVPILQN